MVGFVVYVMMLDAAIIVLCGLLYATLAILDLQRDFFWERLAPAVSALVATSLGAGMLMLGVSWIAG